MDRVSETHLQVSENYSDLTKLRSTINCQILLIDKKTNVFGTGGEMVKATLVRLFDQCICNYF